MEQVRLYHLLVLLGKGEEAIDFRLKYGGKRASDDEIAELLHLGYMEQVGESDSGDPLYRVTEKGLRARYKYLPIG